MRTCGTGATGDFDTVIQELYTLSPADARAAFGAMDGELYGSLLTVGIENTDRFLRTVAKAVAFAKSWREATQWRLGLLADGTIVRGQCGCGCAGCGNGWESWADGYGAGAQIAERRQRQRAELLGRRSRLRSRTVAGLCHAIRSRRRLLADARGARRSGGSGHDRLGPGGCVSAPKYQLGIRYRNRRLRLRRLRHAAAGNDGQPQREPRTPTTAATTSRSTVKRERTIASA